MTTTKPAITQGAHWSGKMPIPDIGDIIRAHQATGPVVGYAIEEGYIAVLMHPKQCDDWMGRVRDCAWHVFGAEIVSVEAKA